MAETKKIPRAMTAEEMQKKIRSGEFKIEIADTTEIAKAEKGVKRVLYAICAIMHSGEEWTRDEWVDGCFVSDESTIGDFLHDEADVLELSKELGFTVTKESYIKDVAVTV